MAYDALRARMRGEEGGDDPPPLTEGDESASRMVRIERTRFN